MQTFDPSTPRTPGNWLYKLGWLYLVGVCLMLAAIRTGGDKWGWATVLAYGPRDLVLVPGVLLLLLGLFRRRIVWTALVAVLIAAGPMMNFIVPWGRLLGRQRSGQVIHLLQLNADGHGTAGRKYDLPRLLSLVRDTGRDVATFEEWPEEDPPPLPSPGWSFARAGELLLISRWPVVEHHAMPSGSGQEPGAMGCLLSMPGGVSQWVFVVHLETPRNGFEPLLERRPGAYATMRQCLARRDRQSADTDAWIVEQAGGSRSEAVIDGDFNLVGDGVVFQNRWGAWTDSFTAAGRGWGQTKLQAGWRVRIDHVLSGVDRTPVRCWVGTDVNSDHLPVLADLQVREQ